MQAEPKHLVFPNKVSHKLMQARHIHKAKILSLDGKNQPLSVYDQPLVTLLNLPEKGLLPSIVSVREL